jgi:cystathionine beta-synthase
MPDLVLVTPDEPAQNAWKLMHELNVSQVVVSVSKVAPLAAKEVSGMLDELSLMDLAFRDPSALERPVRELMSPAMPMIGIGEPVAKLVAALDRSATLLVLDGGHPVGLLSRSDVLGFLAARGAPT